MIDNPEQKKKILPRHDAGSIRLEAGTGSITGTFACDAYLEIYKVDMTFRIQTPESIDPEEINPNAPWVSSPVANVGSSNLTIARVLLQSRDIVELAAYDDKFDKDAVLKQMYQCKEALLACEKFANRLTKNIDLILEQINKHGIAKDNHGRGLNPFPQVDDLNEDCGSLFIQINRAIKLICELPKIFLGLDKLDSNFDHLSERLTRELGEESQIVKFVRGNAETVRYLIDLRNYHEHPKAVKTVIENFKVMPDGGIQVPVWYFEGRGEPIPYSIRANCIAAVDLVRDIAEHLFLHLILHFHSETSPFVLYQIPEEEISQETPIRYRLTIDPSKFKVPISPEGSE